MDQFIGGMKMKIYDISMTIHKEMPVYKNNPNKLPHLENTANYETGGHYESKITMDLHTGTHIDAPLHMIKDGAKMDIYSIEDYVTEAKVIDLTHVEEQITKEDLLNQGIKKGDFILLKTRNSFTEAFDFNFVFLEKSGANYLKELGIKGVGTDALGIERSQPNHETHQTLLSNKIMIVEGLRLKDINPGVYTLVILPLKILNAEAAPARAILIDK
jgi:arylformamidase